MVLVFASYKPYAAMEKIVNGKLLVNDIKKLSPDEQTSSLEYFHNIVCNYSRISMARTLIARLPRLFRTRSWAPWNTCRTLTDLGLSNLC